jgi:hypothetical protein
MMSGRVGSIRTTENATYVSSRVSTMSTSTPGGLLSAQKTDLFSSRVRAGEHEKGLRVLSDGLGETTAPILEQRRVVECGRHDAPSLDQFVEVGKGVVRFARSVEPICTQPDHSFLLVVPGRTSMVVAMSKPIQRPLTHRGTNCPCSDGRRAALVFEGPHHRMLTSLGERHGRD